MNKPRVVGLFRIFNTLCYPSCYVGTLFLFLVWLDGIMKLSREILCTAPSLRHSLCVCITHTFFRLIYWKPSEGIRSTEVGGGKMNQKRNP